MAARCEFTQKFDVFQVGIIVLIQPIGANHHRNILEGDNIKRIDLVIVDEFITTYLIHICGIIYFQSISSIADE
jgi:hypothetical protein